MTPKRRIFVQFWKDEIRRMTRRQMTFSLKGLKLTLFFLFAGAGVSVVYALPLTSQSLIQDSAFYVKYPFIRFVDSQADPSLVRLSDETLLDEAGKIVFRVNRYDAFTNDSLLRELEEVILPRINQDSLQLRLMVVRGAASPEGPVPNNRMLGRRRVETLASFLRAHLDVPVDERSFTTEAVTEDYRLLLAMMRRAGDADLPVVQSLCDRHLPRYEYTLLKRALQRQQGGRLWQRLLKEYFPELRAARVVLFFGLTPGPSPVGEGSEKVQEVYEVLEIPDTLSTLSPQASTQQAPRVLEIPRREFLSVKTNLLFDFAYVPGYNRWCPIPNIAVEYYPMRGHFTYGASFDCPWWQHYDDHKYFQIRNYQVEARYYLRSGSIERRTPGEGAAFRGLYFSAYGHVALYGICFDADNGWEGEALGGGLGVGFVLPLSRKGHWRLEFAAQVGIMYSGYDPYQFENPVNPDYRDGLYYYKWRGRKADFRERQYRFTWIGPTRAAITISYDLLYRRWKKKGVSFRNREYVVEGLTPDPSLSKRGE